MKNNHENYHTCQKCGFVYNFWDFGTNCPNCQQPQTVGDYYQQQQQAQKIQEQKIIVARKLKEYRRQRSIQVFN